MFSESDIKNALAEGSLVVSPLSAEGIRPGGIILHLGENLLKPKPGRVVDVKNKITPEYDAISITEEDPYELQPGEFILGHTYETVTVGRNLGFFIEGRSTLARVGLTVVQTAMLVYPGHRNRTVTLELANHGPSAILLYPKMKIARAAIMELKTPSMQEYDDTGKYREQVSVGPPIFKNEFFKEL